MDTIMNMVVNYYGQKYAERSYWYKYLLHKRVRRPNPLKFRRTMSDLENRALTRFESEVTPLRIDNNNNDFIYANFLEHQAQWRDKTKGLSKLVIVKQCVSCQWMDGWMDGWMDEEARRLRRIGSIKEIQILLRDSDTNTFRYKCI